MTATATRRSRTPKIIPIWLPPCRPLMVQLTPRKKGEHRQVRLTALAMGQTQRSDMTLTVDEAKGLYDALGMLFKPVRAPRRRKRRKPS